MVSGSKRSVRDRLGSNAVDSSMNGNKRKISFATDFYDGVTALACQRGVTTLLSPSICNSNDILLGKHDLRFKLMQKNTPRKIQNNGPQSNFDLRDRLSGRAVKPSVHANAIRPTEVTLGTRQTMAEPRKTSILGHHPSSRTASDIPVSIPARTSYSPWPLDNLRRGSSDVMRSSSSTVVSPENNLDQLQRSTIRPFGGENSSLYMRGNRLSPSRPVSSIPLVDGKSNLYMRCDRLSPSRPFSSLPLGDVKSSLYMRSDRLSPSRPVSSIPLGNAKNSLCMRSDRLSPSRPVSSVPLGDVKPSLYMRSDRLSLSRPVGSVPLLAKTSVPTRPVPSKPVAAVVSEFPPSKVSYVGDERLTMESLLQLLGLEKYAIHFKHEEVDMHALQQMGDTDLKELGIPMGPRKKILQALQPRARRQP